MSVLSNKKRFSSIRINLAIVAGCCLLTMGMQVPPQISTGREYQLKAAFLFNFTQFVEWPEEAFATPNTPMTIGILGPDPFGPFLDQIIAGEKINNRPLVIKRFETAEEVKDCHILFINLKGKEALKEALTAVKSQRILTVSDMDSFIRSGGMVRLVTEKNKIKIRIDLAPADEAGLIFSPKLLRLAEIQPAKNN